MPNKKTIKQLEAELDRYHRRLNHDIRKINEARDLIKKIRLGKVKQPAPPGVKVITERQIADLVKAAHPDPDDPLPSL